jgi:hypothetical protein
MNTERSCVRAYNHHDILAAEVIETVAAGIGNRPNIRAAENEAIRCPESVPTPSALAFL